MLVLPICVTPPPVTLTEQNYKIVYKCKRSHTVYKHSTAFQKYLYKETIIFIKM